MLKNHGSNNLKHLEKERAEKHEELEDYKNEINRLQNEIAKTYDKNTDLENILKEEGDNYRRNENDSKETLIAIHRKWATFSRETLILAKNIHAMAEGLA